MRCVKILICVLGAIGVCALPPPTSSSRPGNYGNLQVRKDGLSPLVFYERKAGVNHPSLPVNWRCSRSVWSFERASRSAAPAIPRPNSKTLQQANQNKHIVPAQKRIVIAASTVLDGKGGVLRNTRIVIDGSRIVAIDSKADPVDYDLRGLTVLPGWIDAHVHITWSFGKDGKNA